MPLPDTPPYATLAEAKAYAPALAGAPEIKAQALLEDAADWVSSLAPEPDPVTDEYKAAARRATLRLVEYLVDVGSLKSKSISGVVSKSYADPDRVSEIVAATMGRHMPGGSQESSNVAIVSRMRF